MRGDEMRGDEMRGDEMRGDEMRGDEMRKSGSVTQFPRLLLNIAPWFEHTLVH
jgi:hypothetical protein